MSLLGYGTAPLGGVYWGTDAAEMQRAVHMAIDRGINFFDSSPYYGLTLSEQRLGDALVGKRQEVIVATKVGRYGLDDFNFSEQRILASIDESLQRLKTDYVDLLQAHDIEFGDIQQVIDETLPALRKIQKSGKARFVGITGYPPKLLARIARAVPVDTVLSYCHYNLLNTRMDDALTPLARNNGIGLINASGLHMGVITARGAPAWHPAPPSVHEAGRKIVEICGQQNQRATDVALRFCLDHEYVSSTLVGMATREEVESNLRILALRSDHQLLASIRQAVASAFNVEWPSGRSENNE